MRQIAILVIVAGVVAGCMAPRGSNTIRELHGVTVGEILQSLGITLQSPLPPPPRPSPPPPRPNPPPARQTPRAWPTPTNEAVH